MEARFRDVTENISDVLWNKRASIRISSHQLSTQLLHNLTAFSFFFLKKHVLYCSIRWQIFITAWFQHPAERASRFIAHTCIHESRAEGDARGWKTNPAATCCHTHTKKQTNPTHGSQSFPPPQHLQPDSQMPPRHSTRTAATIISRYNRGSNKQLMFPLLFCCCCWKP